MSTPAFSARLQSCRTKIVATVGPACAREAQLADLVQAGVDVFRLNTAHGTLDEHAERLTTIRRVSRQAGRPVAVLVDLAGPKMRLGELPEGQVECREGEVVSFVRGESSTRPDEFTTSYPKLVDELDPGDRVMLADGTVILQVESKSADAARCRVVQAGIVRSRQGVNLPGVKLSAPAMDDDDIAAADWAAREGADYISLSFVRRAADIEQLKALIGRHFSAARVVAKIEKPEALEHLDEIVAASHGIMVARGDLGVEIDVAAMPVAQKRIIAACARQQKPVIVATQMLDSMQRSLQPTRAEVTDVANAILDGADACMLSGETAIGEHPRAAVEMIRRIAQATEPLLRDRPAAPAPDSGLEGLHKITEAVVYGAGFVVRQLGARLLIAWTHAGPTALALSKLRAGPPIIGASASDATLRHMCLYWGVYPLPQPPEPDPAALLVMIDDWGRRHGFLGPRDRVVFVRGTQDTPPVHNLLVVYELEDG
jgi:pyruvate kinase